MSRKNYKGPKTMYYASLEFEKRGIDSFFVQSQLRQSGEGGFILAQRWLGVLGLCKLLHLKEFYNEENMFNQSYDPGIEWLTKAANNGDVVSKYILAKCRQTGVGLEQDEKAAEAELERLVPKVGMDVIIAVGIIFEYILSQSSITCTDLSHFCWRLRLAA